MALYAWIPVYISLSLVRPAHARADGWPFTDSALSGAIPPLSPPSWFHQFVTPFTNRKCRDVFWLLCFLLFWGGMLFVGGYAIMFGAAPPAK